MRLYELLDGKAQTKLEDVEVTGLTDDSRKVENGMLFVCVKGGSFDGHSVAANMLEKGAVAVIAERDLGLGDRQIIVKNSREFYGELCAAWFHHPERHLKFIGVTGTNGKTTITNIIKRLLTANGHKVGLIGTIQNEIGDRVIHTDNTTPMVYDLMKLYSEMADEGCDYVVMEVSSFGLAQYRIGPTHFKTAVFTNLTQDHLDYHGTMENYYQAKRMLFNKCDYAVINVDDEYGKRLFNEISCEKVSYSCCGRGDFYADAIKLRANGTGFWLCHGEKSYQLNLLMIGMFNVANVTAAVAACLQEGISMEEIIGVLENYTGVRGRCEVIPTDREFTVICDYAHTPDAIENILSSVKEYTTGRLLCLFGCGGNRDRTKRPKMAAAAAKYADMLIITSDNPRDEEPQAIIDDIKIGMAKTDGKYVEIPDRKEAIAYAIHHGEPGDIIVLAGKGHEDYQEIKGKKYPMDERVLIADILAGK